jgi:DNA-binding response OmpR family regulator
MSTVLVIEDEPDIADNLCDLLDALGYRTLQAHDGASGVEAAQTHRPDLVLCDMQMPGQNGHEVLRAIREADAWGMDVPFAFVTASTDAELKEKSMALGADAFISKPFNIDRLLDTIRALLDDTS